MCRMSVKLRLRKWTLDTHSVHFDHPVAYGGGEIGPWGSCVPWLTAGFCNAAKRPGAAGQVDSKAL
eukprot:5415478-Prymnesium_polylepis.1